MRSVRQDSVRTPQSQEFARAVRRRHRRLSRPDPLADSVAKSHAVQRWYETRRHVRVPSRRQVLATPARVAYITQLISCLSICALPMIQKPQRFDILEDMARVSRMIRSLRRVTFCGGYSHMRTNNPRLSREPQQSFLCDALQAPATRPRWRIEK
jgi:hypothetical protein